MTDSPTSRVVYRTPPLDTLEKEWEDLDAEYEKLEVRFIFIVGISIIFI